MTYPRRNGALLAPIALLVASTTPTLSLALQQTPPADEQAKEDEAPDPAAVIAAIVEEGKNNSQVWKTLTYISEEIGPRLTGSAGCERANVWARETFTEYGLENAHLMRWGEIPVRFDRGPSTGRMVSPVDRELEFTTSAWDAGTDGPVRGKVVKAPTTLEELEAVKGELEGAWVLDKATRRRRGRDREAAQAARELREKINAAMKEAGILGRVTGSSRDQITTGGKRGWRELTMETLPTDVSVTIRRQDYDAINSRLSDGEEVELEFDLKHYFTEGPFGTFNTIAEIPGTEFPDEVVIVSAHLDSWNGPLSQGTQDNGTGSSVTIEAARILMAAGAKPRRTIRFCLWTGEEQGLLGSRGYVESLSEEELSKISACFVDDGGTYYQGGLFCVEEMEPMLTAATRPVHDAFPELPIDIVVREKMPRGGSSDHASFNRKGVPGFFWTEKNRPGLEGMGYRFSWHTQRDTLEYAIEEYLVQSATCSAVTAYSLAMADTLLPRPKPEPKPEPKPTIDANFKAVDTPISGNWDGVFTEPGAPFSLTLAVNAEGEIRGSMRTGDTPLALEKGKWDAEAKTLRFEYESGSFGRLTATAAVKDDGSLAGNVKSSPDSDGYAWEAKKATKTDG